MDITIFGKKYPARNNPDTNQIEAEFPADFDHDGIIDNGVTAWADVTTGWGNFINKAGNKQVIHVDEIGDDLIAHTGQMIKIDSGQWVELYKNDDGSWGTSKPDVSADDFVFDQDDPKPPYGLTKEQLPADADQDIFSVAYELEHV